MDDSPSPFVRTAAHELIVEKRDRLLAERAMLMEQRSQLLAAIRRMDRDLADCKAAARLFHLEIEFPEDEEDREARFRRDREAAILERQRDNMRRHNMARQVDAPSALSPATFSQFTNPPAKAPDPAAVAREQLLTVNQVVEAVISQTKAKSARPSLREVVLDQLRQRPSGAKAADLRDYIERTFGEEIHEKTVGMTLYRLSKESLVRRDGHIWFSAAATAVTENPGADTPGSDNLL